MKPEFEYIELVFENCNTVRISPEYIEFLRLTNIVDDIVINWNHQYLAGKSCKEFELVLDESALGIRTLFEIDHNSLTSSFERHINVFKDITHIAIKPIDKEEIYIAVPWKTNMQQGGKNMLQINALQHVSYTEDTIVITINKK